MGCLSSWAFQRYTYIHQDGDDLSKEQKYLFLYAEVKNTNIFFLAGNINSYTFIFSVFQNAKMITTDMKSLIYAHRWAHYFCKFLFCRRTYLYYSMHFLWKKRSTILYETMTF
jgi:hypothetical protein